MDVSQALQERKSIRQFLSTPVSDETLRELLSQAARAPSGGNLQPWRIFVINGPAMVRFRKHVAEHTKPEIPAYPIYPKVLKEPYRSSRYKVGEDMYALLGITREDKAARFAHLARNFDFFGAPSAFFCFVDRQMGPPQWSDLGMFLQSFMLLAKSQGLDTCAQEAWATKPETVTTFVNAPEELMLFCGMAIGHADPAAKVNSLVSDREPTEEWATFL